MIGRSVGPVRSLGVYSLSGAPKVTLPLLLTYSWLYGDPKNLRSNGIAMASLDPSSLAASWCAVQYARSWTAFGPSASAAGAVEIARPVATRASIRTRRIDRLA